MNPLRNFKLNLFFFFLICLITTSLDAGEKEKGPYKYQIAAFAMFQNEGEWLKEWIEYHRLIGVEHFYLFDNGSTDHFQKVLKPYIKKDIVELYQYPRVGENQQEYLLIQQSLVMQAIQLAKHKAKWLAIIDADEYIVPLQTNSLLTVLEQFENYGGVYVNWLLFGTSHVQKIPPGFLMLEVLNQCATTPTSVGKSIVRPDRVKNCTSPHYMNYKPAYFHVNTNQQPFKGNDCPVADDQLLIYHYYTRDIDHLMNIKLPRRRKWMKIDDAAEYLQQLELCNARSNFTMFRFLPYLKDKVFH